MVRLPDPEEGRDRRGEAGRNVRRRDVLLYALVPERRRVDRPAETRDRLGQLQTELSHPVGRTVSEGSVHSRKAHVRRLGERDAEELSRSAVARPDDGRVVEFDRDLRREDPGQRDRANKELFEH